MQTMAIDDPFDALDKQYPEVQGAPFGELTLGSSTAALAFPILAPLAIISVFWTATPRKPDLIVGSPSSRFSTSSSRA
jgi:hypothetical protein